MITEEQFKEQASVLSCKVSRIKAVYFTEANNNGYLPDGRVKILFEGHRFWKVLSKAGVSENRLVGASGKFPNVLYKKWDKKQYKGGVKEWERMSQAYEVCTFLGVNTALALEAASYGSFQIMGENHEMCGFSSAHEMLASCNNNGEYGQLLMFTSFVKAKKLDVYLRSNPFEAQKFADGYNGTASRLNKYGEKILLADIKYSA